MTFVFFLQKRCQFVGCRRRNALKQGVLFRFGAVKEYFHEYIQIQKAMIRSIRSRDKDHDRTFGNKRCGVMVAV